MHREMWGVNRIYAFHWNQTAEMLNYRNKNQGLACQPRNKPEHEISQYLLL